MITDHDMRDQAREALANSDGDFDVHGIVADIQAAYGTVHLNEVPAGRFWEIVRNRDNS
jgi:hypothetical protein